MTKIAEVLDKLSLSNTLSKRLLILSVVIFSFFFILVPAFACEPCVNVLNLEETIQKADLIIVGQKVANGTKLDYGESEKPDWIEVEVLEVFKGSVPQTKIKINSWDNMCAYGIIINDARNYLMFLQERTSPEEDYTYDTIGFGCAEKTFLVEDNQVNLNGQKIAVETFASTYGLTAFKDTNNRVTPQKQNLKLYIAVTIAILTLLGFLAMELLRRKI